jgi:hypothetical protein
MGLHAPDKQKWSRDFQEGNLEDGGDEFTAARYTMEMRLPEMCLPDLIHTSANQNQAIDREVYLNDTRNVACHTTSSQPHAKRVLHKVRYSASSFNFQ